jgi:iron complex outermembrane recepter protein
VVSKASSATQGDPNSAATYKLALAYRPTDNMLLRASYGSGFKAPTLANISLPRQNGGSTDQLPFPIFAAGDSINALNADSSEYNSLIEGTPESGAKALRPEKTKQATMGIRIEPLKALSLGFDFWDVKMKDQIGTIPVDELFSHGIKYRQYFTAYYDPIQKSDVLAVVIRNVNLNSSHYQGIDWDHSYAMATDFGKLTANWTGTYMLKSEKTSVGGEPAESSVGRFDKFKNVTFRVISKLALSLKTSDKYTHSLTANYHSGYHDAHVRDDVGVIRILNADGTVGAPVTSDRDVRNYYTFDWQSKASIGKNLTVTAGIRNLFNQDPPFSQRVNGGGNQLGFDGRYTDPLGRQIYLVGSLKF